MRQFPLLLILAPNEPVALPRVGLLVKGKQDGWFEENYARNKEVR